MLYYKHIVTDSVESAIKKVAMSFATMKKIAKTTDNVATSQSNNVTLEEAELVIARFETAEGQGDAFLEFLDGCERDKLSQEERMKCLLETYSNYVELKDGHLYIKVSDTNNEETSEKEVYTIGGEELKLAYLTKPKSNALTVVFYEQTKDGNVKNELEGYKISHLLFVPLGNNGKYPVTGFTMYRNSGDQKKCYCRQAGKYFPNDFGGDASGFICQTNKSVTITNQIVQGKKKIVETLHGTTFPNSVCQCEVFAKGKCYKTVRTVVLTIGELNKQQVIIPCWFDVKGAYGYAFYSSSGEFGLRDGTAFAVGDFVEVPLESGRYSFQLEHFKKNDKKLPQLVGILRSMGESFTTLMNSYFPFSKPEKQAEETRFEEDEQ